MIRTPYLAAAITFVITAALLPLVRFFCSRLQLFDAPGPLKIHSQPTPRLGGAAIFLGISAAMIATDSHSALVAWPFFAALALVFFAGFADDLRSLSPAVRVSAQFCAGILLWIGGWRMPVGNPALSIVVNAAIVVASVNAVNLWDGIDALASGAALMTTAAYLALPSNSISAFAQNVAWVAAAACLAFLPRSWPRASLFLGDSGSNLLGFLAAFLALDFYRSQPAAPAALLFPILATALPLSDAVFAALRRLRAGQSVLFGDRRHLYDLLRARGWPVSIIVLTLSATTALFAAIGLCGVRTHSRLFWPVSVSVVSLYLGAAIRLGSLRYEEKVQPAAINRLNRLSKEEGVAVVRAEDTSALG